MIRMHLDDLHDLMPHAQFAFLKRWLEEHGAIIVQCDPVPYADRMTGGLTTRRGRWGQDEPYPPYGGYRKLLEDAREKGPPTSG